jgi:menaquinone-dependent protoporphyrinogen oxidase
MSRTLITYASAHQSTAEISTQIYKTLTLTHPNTDILPIDSVSSTDLQKYTSIIIGSAVHGIHWLPSAVKFLETNVSTLKRVPLWAFSVGAPTAMPPVIQKLGLTETKEESVLKHHIVDILEAQKAQGVAGHQEPNTGLREHVLFGGRFEKSDAGLVTKTIWAVGGGKFGDFRDPGAIEAWAKKVAGEIGELEKGKEAVTESIAAEPAAVGPDMIAPVSTTA